MGLNGPFADVGDWSTMARAFERDLLLSRSEVRQWKLFPSEAPIS